MHERVNAANNLSQHIACNFPFPAYESLSNNAISLCGPGGTRHQPRHGPAWVNSTASKPERWVTLLRVPINYTSL